MASVKLHHTVECIPRTGELIYTHYHVNNLIMKDSARGRIRKFLSDACRTVLLNLPCGVDNFDKVWSACWQQEIQNAKRRLRTYA